MTPTLEPEPMAPDAAAPAVPRPPPAATAAPTPKPTVVKDAAPPPLSSPNPIVDGGAAPTPEAAAPAPSGPPETTEAALSQAGHAVLDCFGDEKEMAGAVLVRVTVNTAGKVTRVDIVKDKSTAALLGGSLEKCIRGVFQRQQFPAQRTESVLDVPLDFKAPEK